MDTKRLLVIMLVSTVVVFGWAYVGNYLRQTHPEWYAQPDPPTQAGGGESQTRPTTEPSATQAATTQALPPLSSGTLRAVGGDAARVMLGQTEFDPDGKQPYPIGVELTTRGAAVQSVTLNRFRAGLKRQEPYVYQQPYGMNILPAETRALAASMAARHVLVNGKHVNLWDVNWRLTGQEKQEQRQTATFEVDILGPDGQKLLTIRKQYTVRTHQDDSRGYEVAVDYTLVNHTGAVLPTKLFYNGPTLAIESRNEIPEVVVGLDNDQRVKLTHSAASSYTPEKGEVSLVDARLPMLWTGITSAYFEGLVRPTPVEGQGWYLSDVRVQAAAPAAPVTAEQYPAFTFETLEQKLAPDKPTELKMEAYFGPRWRDVLKTPYYAAFPRSYGETLVLSGGMCGFCTFAWLIDALVWLLGVFHWLFGGFASAGDWGLAIIALVILVRLALHPITKRSQINMAKMAKMGPEVERLKKKHGDNKEELNRAMMGFYKEQGATPILGCLPMLIQMPIWIALWSGLQSTFELRLSPFLWGFTWIDDLSQPDRLLAFRPIPLLFGWTVDGVNILPMLLAVVFFLQQKYMQPPQQAMTPEQEQQQKMMKWMTLLFPLLLYNGPSGLNLYILTSTGLGIWESKRVRAHLQEQDEREKQQRILVDAKPTRASKKLHEQQQQQPQAKESGCMGGWLAELQKKAEHMKTDSQRRPKGK